ncbi:MAG: HAD family hydrolase [Bryobacteraceae bacterium]
MLEIVRPISAASARVAIFDFDGTLSLIRTGWVEVMVPMMVGLLLDLKTGESEADLRKVVDEFVWRLTGKETIYQMMALADEITARGGSPLDPRIYKQQYLDLLWETIKTRVEALRSGKASPEDHLVPGSRPLLESLKARGIKMYLASGTDHAFVMDEANLLDISKYFDGGVFGALDDLKAFSKAILIQKILSTAEFTGEELLGFGDGYVEIEEVKKAGGVTVGVATTEPECRVVDDWKRKRLIGVGADYIVPNFEQHEKLLATLFANGQA